MASTTRPYLLLDADSGEGIALVEASSPAAALRIMADKHWTVQAASAKDVLAAVKDGVPMIEASATQDDAPQAAIQLVA
jgi:hypothetical protein